jgi:isopentenyl diphosphate isomerase/L-lactate dehydrogenase-like FMN-dependent dehydrogenase
MSRLQRQSLQRRAFLKYLAASPLLAYAPSQGFTDESQRFGAGLDSDRIIESADDAIDVFDFEAAAQKALPPAHFAYMAWGLDGGAIVQLNRDGFARIGLRARRLVDVTQVDTSTELFGKTWKTPIILAPTGSEKAFHSDGAITAAKAARSRGHLQILSTMSTSSIEEVTEATGGPLWYQLYATPRWSVTEGLLKRAEAAGCPAVAVTVDSAAGRVLRDVRKRAKYTDSRQCLDCHVMSVEGYARRKPMFDGMNLAGLSTLMAPQLTWEVVDRIKDATRMKVVLKGIVTREDAQLCIQHGVDGIIVSNHGGRSDGGGRATIACLPEVVAGVEGRIPVLVDSGFRRGSDIFKAIALGARAVCIGRPYLWGLASFGQSGVEAVLDMLREELELAMRVCGTPSIRQIGPAHVQAI